MSFLSPGFVLLVAVSAAAFRLSPAHGRRHVLLGASCLVYAVWDPLHLVLLLGLTLAVHRVALHTLPLSTASAVERRPGGEAPQKRPALAVTAVVIVALLCTLFAFKAAAGHLEAWRAAPAGPELIPLLAAPLGLSYYLFRLIGYLLDVYWQRMPAQPSFGSVALYAAFFPQIASGPIQRAGDFFSQLDRLAPPPPDLVAAGLRRILFGLVKKVAVADRLADLVAALHGDPSRYSSLELLVGAYAFAIQLYADFSGLTDIALGIGQLFGIRGPENFDRPFFAPNLQEYWRRWHMSLTSWLRDYLFTPLRMGLRHFGSAGLAAAVFANMLAVGIWHGASWTYAAFGAVHGVLLAASVLTLKRRNELFRGHPRLSRLRAVAGPLVTFHLVVLALVVFRASSVPEALQYLSRLVPRLHGEVPAVRLSFALAGITPRSLLVIFATAAALEAIEWAGARPRWRRRFLEAPRLARWTLYYAGVAVLLLWGTFAAQKFIYAQF